MDLEPEPVQLGEAQRIIDGKVVGIGDQHFSINDGTDEITASSGARMYKTVRPDRVSFASVDDQVHHLFDADVHQGTLRLAVANKDHQGQRHPDLFIKSLVRRSLRFFAQHGNPVEKIELRWLEFANFTDDYTVFHQALTGTKRDKESLESAVWATWGGQLAREMGYSHIVPNEDDSSIKISDASGSVTVTFTKP